MVGPGDDDADRGQRDRAGREPPPPDALRRPSEDRAEEPDRQQQEDETGGRDREVEGLRLEPVGHVRERPDVDEEQRPADGRHGDEGERHDLAQRPGAAGRSSAVGEAAHRERRRERERREQRARDPPADDAGRQRHADPTDQPAEHERPDVPPHRPGSDSRHQRLDDVRRTDDEQARHAEPLQDPCGQEHLEGRRERDEQRRPDEQQARQAHRPWTPDAIGERPPQPRRQCEREDEGRDAETGACRAHVERVGELGQDRLRRVHRGEHPERAEQEPEDSLVAAGRARLSRGGQWLARTPRCRSCAPVSRISPIWEMANRSSSSVVK